MAEATTIVDDEFLLEAEELVAAAVTKARQSKHGKSGKKIASRAMATLAGAFISLAKQYDVEEENCLAMFSALWEMLDNDEEVSDLAN